MTACGQNEPEEHLQQVNSLSGLKNQQRVLENNMVPVFSIAVIIHPVSISRDDRGREDLVFDVCLNLT